MSIASYQRVQDVAQDGRTVEHRTLGRVTGMLIDGAKSGGRPLVDAVYYNRKLWSIFLTDCANDTNGLPEATRAEIISLGMFVQRYSAKVLAHDASIDPLVSINRSIMEGLAPQRSAAAAL